MDIIWIKQANCAVDAQLAYKILPVNIIGLIISCPVHVRGIRVSFPFQDG